MTRTGYFAIVLCFMSLPWSSCKREDPSAKPDPEGEKLTETQAQLQDLKQREIDLKNKLLEAKSQLTASRLSVEQSLLAVQAALDGLGPQAAGAAADSTATGDEATSEEDEANQTKGWPWWVKALLILAIVLIFFTVYNHLISEDDYDEDEEDFLDEEFLEENDLGTVRYPGVSKPPRKDGASSGDAGDD